MARHSHWHQIRLKKGAEDQKRGKIFTRHARLIEIAARNGGADPGMNASLRIASENARADNMPRENIERAIKKGTGALGAGEQMQEATYEGYGPGGIALVVDVLTDNKNRTNQTVRGILQKFGGSLAGIGATSFLFELRGIICAKQKGNKEEDELAIIDSGAADIEEQDGGFVIYTVPNELSEVKKKLEGKGFSVESSQLSKVPKNLVSVTDPESAKKILALIDALENEDDISSVAANFDIPENP